MPERVKRRAPQRFHARQQPENVQRAGAKSALCGPPVRAGAAKDRWREAEIHAEIAIKFRAHLGLCLQVQPRHLVFVLVGEQFVIAERHRRFQPRIGDGIDQFHITPRQPGRLIDGQMRHAKGDLLLQRFRLFADIRRQRPRRLIGVNHRPTAQFKRAFVALDRGLVQLNRAQNRRLGQRDQPHLPRRAKHHHVGIDRVAQQHARQFCSVKQRQPVLDPCFKTKL
ncbi:hypothetical protein GALL_472150 [mine drainage metagenome]|uniref:Uncharacterized protein n=1 Tax=mine drainage metagenome TaxID=410659 RepID=A0A1J5Q103_9ZZZZ